MPDTRKRTGLGDDLAVHQHQIGVARQHQIALERALGGVDDAERAARRVGRGQGGDHRHRQRQGMRHRLRGIQRLAAARADDDGGIQVAGAGGQTGDFLVRTFAAEAVQGNDDGALLRDGAQRGQHHGIDHRQRGIAQAARFLGQQRQGAGPLHIA
jgi:hypothetical protein